MNRAIGKRLEQHEERPHSADFDEIEGPPAAASPRAGAAVHAGSAGNTARKAAAGVRVGARGQGAEIVALRVCG
jgi:hypothetical protein